MQPNDLQLQELEADAEHIRSNRKASPSTIIIWIFVLIVLLFFAIELTSRLMQLPTARAWSG